MYKIYEKDDVKKELESMKNLDENFSIVENAEYIVMEDSNNKFGYITMLDEDKKYIIKNIFIKKEDRFKSNGTKLIKFFITHSKKMKKEKIIYKGENSKIINFLKKNSFKENENELVMTIKDGDRQKDGIMVAGGSILLNIFLAVIKIFGGIKGKSNALIADGFNSLSDVISSIAILLGIYFSNIPGDEEHPYGHEKIESIIGNMVGLFVVITAFEIGKGAIMDLINGTIKEVPSFSAIYLALISIIVKYGMYFYKMKVGKVTKNAALIADARDSKSDVFSSSGVIIGILLSIYVSPIFDTIVTLIVALLILKEGVSTILETSDIILDKQENDLIKDIENYIYENTNIKNVHDIYMRRSGDKIFLTLHIRVEKDMTVYKAHHLSDDLRESIMTDFDEVKEVMIHIDYLID